MLPSPARLRLSSYSMAAVLLAAVIIPARAGWAEKSPPVPQWGLDAAKTSTPDYAKSTRAVVLYDETVETIDAQGRAVEHERKATRILQPQGRSDAACGVSYDVDEKINSFHSWTIAADGRQFPARDADIADIGRYGDSILQFTERARTVNPPAADPGATVLCETEELLAPYQHEVRLGDSKFHSRRRSNPRGRPANPVRATPSPGIDSRPSGRLRSLPITGVGKSKTCTNSTCAA